VAHRLTELPFDDNGRLETIEFGDEGDDAPWVKRAKQKARQTDPSEITKIKRQVTKAKSKKAKAESDLESAGTIGKKIQKRSLIKDCERLIPGLVSIYQDKVRALAEQLAEADQNGNQQVVDKLLPIARRRIPDPLLEDETKAFLSEMIREVAPPAPLRHGPGGERQTRAERVYIRGQHGPGGERQTRAAREHRRSRTAGGHGPRGAGPGGNR